MQLFRLVTNVLVRPGRSGAMLGATGVAGSNGQGVGAPASPWPRMRAGCSRLLKALHHVTTACTDSALMRRDMAVGPA